MKTIFFLLTSALTAVSATVVLTGTPVPHPSSFSIPLPEKTNDKPAPLDQSTGGPLKLNLIDVQDTGMLKVLDQDSPLVPVADHPALNQIPAGIQSHVESNSAPHVKEPASNVIDLDSLWANTSLQKLLEKSADTAITDMSQNQTLPPATKQDLVRVEPEDNSSLLVAAEPVINAASDTARNESSSLNKMIEETISTIPTHPVVNQPETLKPVDNRNLVKNDSNLLTDAADKITSNINEAKDSLSQRFDSLVNELTTKKNSNSGRREVPKANSMASIPNVELNKKSDQAEKSPQGTEPVAEVKSTKTQTATEENKVPEENVKKQTEQPGKPNVVVTGAPKKIAYVSWKKGYLTTDKRQMEYQNSGKGKIPVLITGSMSGRDLRNPPLMDRILYRLTSNENLDSLAKYLLVRSPNPDGHAYGLAGNIRGVDLTKNFYLPQNQIVGLKSDKPAASMADDRLEIETRIFMHMLREFKPELVVQIRLHPDKTVPTVEYPSRLQGRVTPFLNRQNIKGLEVVQPVPGSVEYYIKTVTGADYLTIYFPDHGNVDEDWLNNRGWFTELLNLCVNQEEIKNELVAAEPVKTGPQAHDETVSYGSVTPLSPSDPSRLQGEVEFLPPPPGKAGIAKESPVESGYIELPAPPKKGM